MNKLTERLVQITAITMILWFGWNLAKESIVNQIVSQQTSAGFQQKLASCESEKAKMFSERVK